MSNIIKLKRGSGSDPSASDLVVGEVALRTDTGEIFLKKDDNSVAKLSGGGLSDGDKGDITVSNNAGTFSIDSGVIDNANIASNAAIAGSKISPDFGSQNIQTTGNLTANRFTLDSAVPKLIFTDTTHDPDYQIVVNSGKYMIEDITNNAERFRISSNGNVKVFGNLDADGGIDVTGNITVTGTVDGVDIAALNTTVGTKLPLAGGTLTGDLTINESHPSIFFVDSGDNPDYEVGNHDGAFVIQDDTNGVNRLVVNSDGHIDIAGNLDVGSGIDVTGASTFEATTFTGNVTLTSVTPQLYFTDTNHDPDFAIWNHNGVLRFLDTTNSNATRLEIQASGLVKASNSFEVTGNITVSGTVDGVDIATRDTLFGGLTSSSGVLSNGVTATTQAQSDNSNKVSTTAYVRAAVANLVNSAPSTLDTLKELSDALGADANFSTTVTNSIATKMPLAGGTFTGDIEFNGHARIVTGDITNTNTTKGLMFDGNYEDGRYRTRFRKDDKGGGLPLYIDSSEGTANSYTAIARFGGYANNTQKFEVFGNTRIDGNLELGVYDQTGVRYLYLNGNSVNVRSTLHCTNGNLHIDCNAGNNTYLNYYTGSGTYFGGGATNVVAVMGVDGDLWKGSSDNSGSKYWHAGNDGSGSGLDADTVDGVHASSFLRSDTGDSASGSIIFDATQGIRLKHGNETDTNDGFIASGRFSSGLNIVGTQTTSGTGRQVRIWGEVLTNGGNKFWNAGNDGSGSGLDADTLDGVQGANYVRNNNGNQTIAGALTIDVNGTDDGATTLLTLDNYIADIGTEYTWIDFTFRDSNANATPQVRIGAQAQDPTGNQIQEGTGDFVVQCGVDNNSSTNTMTEMFRCSHEGKVTSVHHHPASDSDYDLGTSSVRWRNIYADTLYGDGSNITGVNATTLDSIDSGSFLRSDANDTATGAIQFTSTGLELSGHWYSRFYSGTQNYIHLYPGGHSGNASTTDIRAWTGSTFKVLRINGASNDITWGGQKIWTAANDGSGSTLDADTVDGIQGSSLLRSDADDTASGQITLSNSGQYPLVIDGANNAKFVMQGSDNPYIRFRNSADTDKGYVQYNTSDGNVMYVWNSHHGQGIQIGSSFKFYHGSAFRTVWHENNDGSGSGLDADTVDGLHSSSFLGATATAVEAFALDIDDTRNDGTRVPNDYADHKVTAEFSNQIASLGAWWAALTVKGWHDGYAPWQLIGHASTGQNINLYARFGHGSNNTFSSLYKIWHEGVDGSGSGLDADTVDGLHSTSFVRNNNNNGHILQFGSGSNTGHTASSYAYAIFQEGGAWSHPYPDLRINYHTGIILAANVSYGGVRFQKDYNDTTELFSVGNGDNHVRVANTLYIGGNTAFHGGNDGSGSGLDADTLDGTQANALIRGGAQSSVSGWHISAYRNGSGTSPHIYFSHNGGYGQHINTYNTSDSVYNLELHNNVKQLFVVYNSGRCIHGGNVLPAVGNTYDLGSTSARWQNLYVNDMHFSNKGKTNDVDGSWGDWTLQEGENDIFMINNRSGKKFKIAMIPV